ncbi:hypothetical protein [Pseudobacteroides cellulosolvens]|uniref:Uncharacterized protein n=1 Tax=Pseudobacteroides cellulosolvens ATCC 35603 = DSM 2933 TaxID=398512 RepID=A0A0L6JIV8_9FIRM|nr:hypothetical protein [Pseudobacteroides cellulosolvens]KNY25781.1 hypothetical protein Bccel_1041 [Pseudobacteroides cellulosolvens ATCC 35603 = DSM 2933]
MNNLKIKTMDFLKALNDVQKSVKVSIDINDLQNLKAANYCLCFAKKVNNAYTVVWQSYDKYLVDNTFSWTPQYQLFGTNTFQDNITVNVNTNIVNIGLSETSILNQYGVLGNPVTGGADTGFTMDNQYGSIHPGVNQVSTGINGQITATPIYVAEAPIMQGTCFLQPVEKALIWFEQDIQTGTMFSTARSRDIEVDLTQTNSVHIQYKNQQWSII